MSDRHHIYFVAIGPGEAFKIGVTHSLWLRGRVKALRAAIHRDVVFLGAIAGSHAAEKKIHRLCAPYRIRNEFFRDCAAMRAVISEALNNGRELVTPSSLEAMPNEPVFAVLKIHQGFRRPRPTSTANAGQSAA